MKIQYMGVLIWILIFGLTGCTITNKFGPYYGKVVDGETKQPIEGAAVLLVYYTAHYSPGGSILHFADAQETVTDINGEFRLPAVRINAFSILSGWDAHPPIHIFKPGYGCYPMHKYALPKYDYSSLPVDQHVTIELPRLDTREQRLENQRCGPTAIPEVKCRAFEEKVNEERKALGLDIITTK